MLSKYQLISAIVRTPSKAWHCALRTVSYERYIERKKQWNKRLSEGIQRRRFNRDPQTFLQQLEDQWDQVDVVNCAAVVLKVNSSSFLQMFVVDSLGIDLLLVKHRFTKNSGLIR